MIQWDASELSVGVAEIDEQHRHLIEVVHELNRAMAQGKSKEVLGTTLQGLVTYVSKHFATEEKYFDQFRYKETFGHKREHAQFAQKVEEFFREYEEGKRGLSIEIIGFLSEWLTTHVRGSDMKYVECFRENGLR